METQEGEGEGAQTLTEKIKVTVKVVQNKSQKNHKAFMSAFKNIFKTDVKFNC